MKKLPVTPILVPALFGSILFIGACSKASFSGKSSSRNAPPTVITGGPLSCEVNPVLARPGEPVKIVVNSTEQRPANIVQDIKGPNYQKRFSLVDGADGYTIEGSGANQHQFTAEGEYIVELRFKEQEAAVGGCSFRVKTKPAEPSCKPGEVAIGADLAFLIDNSNSNASTDCPNPQAVGTHNGAKTYQCQGMTNREKAVNDTMAILDNVAKKYDYQSTSLSRLAVASFPTIDEPVDGWAQTSQGWIAARTASAQTISSAMAFSRKPFGMTPYGAAMSAATQLFSKTPTGERAKVAILVTDGEPTDRDPRAVAAQAAQLKQQGVELITVFVTGRQTRLQRHQYHTQMMASIDAASRQQPKNPSPWYNPQAFNSFATYIDALLGTTSGVGLAAQVSSPKAANCQDGQGQFCERQVIEIQDSSLLSDVFADIIRTKVVRCE